MRLLKDANSTMPPPDHSAPGTPREWLARARSSLALANVAKPEETAWEDLCFQAQQAAEKAIKAALQHNGIVFPYVHDLQVLLDLLETKDVRVPEAVKLAAVLSRYAFQTRYPGDYVPVTQEDYREATKQARTVLEWSERMIEGEGV